jgi:peptide/nickel transport system substrate-binding protein
MTIWKRGMRRRDLLGAAVIACASQGVATLSAVPAAANIDRLVIVMSPPVVESNLIWVAGIAERLPFLQSLVGNDPVTGAYDNSGLARAWEANEDRTEWTFYLHEDAEFHFGWGPVTAHDVVHSYELHTGPDAQYGGLPRLRAKEVEALDNHTVVFRFDTPYIDYAFVHAGRVEMMIYSRAQYEAEGQEGYHRRPAGTAPYQYVERRIGEGVLLERAPDQWQGIEPDFAELELRYVTEPATKLAMLLTGEAHIVDLPREIQREALDAGFEIVASRNPAMTTGANFNGLYQRTGDEAHSPDLPWADVRVREAMNRAVNREEMIEILYGGRAEIVPSMVFDPRHEGWLPELMERFEADYGYDPERAKELLAEAGYPDAFPDPVIPIVSSVLTGNPEFGTMTELLQVYFEEIGLQTEIREMDWASLGALGRGRRAYLVHPIRNAPIRPTETGLQTFFTSQGAPYGGYESDAIEGLVEELRRTIDQDERERIAAEAFTYLYGQYADMPLAAVDFELVVDPKVVAGWTFPGVTTNSVSHWHLIKAAE